MFIYQNKNIIKGFTLIELLIVIIIIGVLIGSFIPKIQGLQDRARYIKVEKDFQDFRAAVFLAQSNTNKPLRSITNHNCTSCSCWSGVTSYSSEINFKKLDGAHGCRTNRITSLRKIEVAAGMDIGSLSSLETDPWGSPYYLDENEGEFSTCVPDLLFTVGPDGFRDGINRSNPALSSGDNRGFHVAPQGCTGAY